MLVQKKGGRRHLSSLMCHAQAENFWAALVLFWERLVRKLRSRFLEGEKGWRTYGRDFVPRIKTMREGKLELVRDRGPGWCRIMLYAYVGSGTIHWDDVVLKKIADPPKMR